MAYMSWLFRGCTQLSQLLENCCYKLWMYLSLYMYICTHTLYRIVLMTQLFRGCTQLSQLLENCRHKLWMYLSLSDVEASQTLE
jgi:hypothetical protein